MSSTGLAEDYSASTISRSADEKAAGEFDMDSVARAIRSVTDQGFVVVEDVVPHEVLDTLRERMTEDTEKLVAARDRGESVAGWMYGHFQQGPPPCAPYVFADIVANPFIVQVTRGVLGDGVFNAFYSGNTNIPGSQEQPLHRDALPLWPKQDYAHPATTLVVNISPVDVDEVSGSTEIWPGTHRVNGELREDLVEQRRHVVPPTRVRARKGSAVVRDIRLWHRGVCNESAQIRHMIAMVHQIHWYRRAQTLRFQKGCEPAFEGSDLDANAQFVDGPLKYLFDPPGPHS